MDVRAKIARFQPSQYFEVGVDSRSSESPSRVKLTDGGIDLVAEYNSEKYHMAKATRFDKSTSLAEHIKKNVLPQHKNQDDVRVPFILSSVVEIKPTQSQSTHSTPIVYVKEGGREALLVFDSLGNKAAADDLAKATGLQVYYVPMLRQLDYYSCHTEALVYSRDLTGKNDNGVYLIPDLLTRLEKNAPPNQNPARVKLFDLLLLTAQSKDFVAKNRSETEEIVHRGTHGEETLEQFMKRYPDTGDYKHSVLQPASSYVREKGLKYANTIEIQYYLKQLQAQLGELYTKEVRDDFIKKAKTELKSQGKVTYDNLQHRAGLYQFTQKYLASKLGVEFHAEVESKSPKFAPDENAPKPPFKSYSNRTYTTPEQSVTDPSHTEPKMDYASYYENLSKKYREEDEAKTKSSVDQPKMSGADFYQSIVKKHKEEDEAMSRLSANENSEAKKSPSLSVTGPSYLTEPKSGPTTKTKLPATNHSQLYPSFNSDNFVKIKTKKFVEMIAAVQKEPKSTKAIESLNGVLEKAKRDFSEAYQTSRGNVPSERIDEIENRYLQQMNDHLKTNHPNLLPAFLMELSRPRRQK